mmetsp:Transcript_48671/g.98969  ORF Transcript_48671/g.98969 Transcript_48671/m.98969 type:complete len:102 (-) Transcript_48671:87-392(-)
MDSLARASEGFGLVATPERVHTEFRVHPQETLVFPDLNQQLEHAPLDLLDVSERSFTLSPGTVRRKSEKPDPADPPDARTVNRNMSSEGFKYKVLPQDENA